MSNLNIDKLKEKYPKMPQDIKDTVLETVNSELSKKSAPKQPYLKVAGIGLAILLGIGGTCYAASKLARLNVEKVGEYGADISVVTEASSTDENTGNNDEAVESSNIVVDFSDLPDGYVLSHSGSNDIMTDYKAIVSHPNYNMSEENASIYAFSLVDGYESFNVKDSFVKSTETFEVEDATAIYLDYERVGDVTVKISSKIYMVYPEFNLLLEICGFNDISKEEMYSLANCIKVYAATADDPLYTKASALSKDDVPVFVYDDSIETTPSDKYLSFVDKYSTISKSEFEKSTNKIGEERYYDSRNKLPKEKTDNNVLGVKVSNVQILDNLSSLGPGIYDFDINKVTDANGNLVDESIQYIKFGDGINTADEIIKTETKKMKFVLVSIDITNYSATTTSSCCFNPGLLIRVKEEGDILRVYNNSSSPEEGIDAVVNKYYSDNGLPCYFYNGVDASQKNNVALPLGETTTVYSGFFVAEDELSDMYLELIWADEDNSVFGYNKNEISLPLQNKGFFDIRQ